MLRKLLFSLVLVSGFANAADLLSCEQQQTLCTASCSITEMGDEQGLSACRSKCAGKRVSCSVQAGTEKLKSTVESATATTEESTESASSSWKDNAEAFWSGLKGD